MAKRSASENADELEEKKEAIAVPHRATYNYFVKQVRSMVQARIIYRGHVTGNRYEWPAAGSVVPVDERDVPELLSKKLGGRSCCGPQGANTIFELI